MSDATTTPAPTRKQRIVSLSISNFKRIVAIDLQPERNLQIISGRNAQGKSSVLDAITAVLYGKRRKGGPEPAKMPIRSGAKRGRSSMRLDDYRITRKWSETTDELTIEPFVDGVAQKPIKSPQAWLDENVGELSFDALAFSRMTAKEQAALLRRLIPGLDCTDLDTKETALREDRRKVGTERDLLEGQVAGVVIPVEPPAAPERVDVMALMAESDAATKLKADGEAAAANVTRAREAIGDIDGEIAELEKMIGEKKVERSHAVDALQQVTAVAASFDPEAAAARKREIMAKLGTATEANKAADEFTRATAARKAAIDERAKRQAAYEAKAEGYRRMSDAIEEIQAERQKRTAAAELPLPGMSLDGDTILIDGVPFSQAASSQQLRMGLEIGAKLNPIVEVVLVKDGSLLDEEGVAMVGAWAAERDMQVWMEVVSDGATGFGVVIEDGAVKVAKQDEQAAQ